jgi:alginate O-acetyltransferase complex protein AlgI
LWQKFNDSKLGFAVGIVYLNFASIVINTCFRAESISKEWIHLTQMFQYNPGSLRPYMYKTAFLVLGLFIMGHILGYWIFEKEKKKEISPVWEVSLYPLCILILAYLTPEAEIPFVYFQF